MSPSHMEIYTSDNSLMIIMWKKNAVHIKYRCFREVTQNQQLCLRNMLRNNIYNV